MEGEEGLQVRLTGEASVGDVSLGVFTRRDVLPYNAVWSAVCDDDTHLCEKQISAVTKREGQETRGQDTSMDARMGGRTKTRRTLYWVDVWCD